MKPSYYRKSFRCKLEPGACMAAVHAYFGRIRWRGERLEGEMAVYHEPIVNDEDKRDALLIVASATRSAGGAATVIFSISTMDGYALPESAARAHLRRVVEALAPQIAAKAVRNPPRANALQGSESGRISGPAEDECS